jgi:arginase
MEIVGVPFDLCGFRPGSRLGPAAVRLAGLRDTLEAAGQTVVDEGDITIAPETPSQGIRHYDAAFHAYEQIHDRVLHALQSDRRPVVVGGDHSLSIGSAGAALTHFGSDLTVLWIDAHADLNSPGTSPSGNLHGMPLGCLLHEPSRTTGLADLQWKSLQERFAPHPLLPERVGWLGLRDLDNGERERIAHYPREYCATMSHIDRHGMMDEVDRLDEWMRIHRSKSLWISFDVDVLDPFLAPGTGTAVRGGLTYREMHLLGELLYEHLNRADCPYRLVGMDIVETNPLFDTYNATAKVAVEFIASLFGKTILGI